MRVFISYAHVDKPQVRDLVEILDAGGHDPWFDHHLTVGKDWMEELLKVIRQCDAFIYVLSPQSVESDWCQWEFQQAVELGKPILPVLLKKTFVPEPLSRLQYADFSEGPTARSAALLLGGLLAARPVEPETVSPSPAQPKGTPPQDRGQQEPEAPPANQQSMQEAIEEAKRISGEWEQQVVDEASPAVRTKHVRAQPRPSASHDESRSLVEQVPEILKQRRVQVVVGVVAVLIVAIVVVLVFGGDNDNADTQTATCTIVNTNEVHAGDPSVLDGPSYDAMYVKSLQLGFEVRADGYATDEQGTIWWHIGEDNWIPNASWLTVAEACYELPQFDGN